MGAWTLLLLAAALEVVWALALKQSEGFTRLVPGAIGVTAAVASFGLLAAALARLPVGSAYAVWVGVGAAGVAVVGIAFLGDVASPGRLGCLVLIVAGVAGLRLLEG